MEFIKKWSEKWKPIFEPDDWSTGMRMVYKIFGIPLQGYFYHSNMVWFYESTNGLMDIYSIQGERKKFLETISYKEFRDKYLSLGQKVFSDVEI